MGNISNPLATTLHDYTLYKLFSFWCQSFWLQNIRKKLHLNSFDSPLSPRQIARFCDVEIYVLSCCHVICRFLFRHRGRFNNAQQRHLHFLRLWQSPGCFHTTAGVSIIRSFFAGNHLHTIVCNGLPMFSRKKTIFSVSWFGIFHAVQPDTVQLTVRKRNIDWVLVWHGNLIYGCSIGTCAADSVQCWDSTFTFCKMIIEFRMQFTLQN